MKETCFKIFQQKHVIELLLSITEKPKGFNELQKEHAINTSTLQKRLVLMQKAGLIEKKPCPHDARSVFYTAKEKGSIMSDILRNLRETFNTPPK